MQVRERIFHMVLFELVALVLMAGLAILLLSEHDPFSLTGLAVSLSLIAMGWNYLFNLGFDRIFGDDRINRSLWMRIGHGIAFEAGLIVVTLPMMMWVLEVDFFTALMLDLGAILFFLIYAILFNWAYDLVRHKLVSAEPVR